MTPENAFETCLQLLEQGESVENCLARFPQYAAELAPLLHLTARLQTIPAPPATPMQIAAMQERILTQVIPPAAPRPYPLGKIALALLAGVLVLLAGVMLVLPLLRGTSENAPAAPVSFVPTLPAMTPLPSLTPSPLPPTLTPPHTASPTSAPSIVPSSTTSVVASITPAPDITASPVSLPPSESDILPIYIEFSGAVDYIDEEASTITLNGVLVELDMTWLPPDVQIGTVLAVGGELLDNGVIVSENVAPAVQAEVAPPQEPCPEARCHPILLILSQAYVTDYSVLHALHQEGQLGVGEIARMLAIAEIGDNDLATLAEQRQSGMSWGDILATYPMIQPNTLGVTIRENRASPGRPDNTNASQAPGQGGNPPGQGAPSQGTSSNNGQGADNRNENANPNQNGNGGQPNPNNNGNQGNNENRGNNPDEQRGNNRDEEEN